MKSKLINFKIQSINLSISIRYCNTYHFTYQNTIKYEIEREKMSEAKNQTRSDP